ncbi:hypothetical protein CANARDRAFT_27658 [[Candida] arabinofermentans NRRL YB-2248]|uniref:Uncharacterized protein n=1 Tax=[Candida] arabinofermentans NRRL YB-2248 TaxID=983967 RepID=A0A1E4T3V8_9ASCO|nr:hypothetical protein CANARDRAFT_27658 [[Candida] arabinofermentans NRRL YB-2248]
MALHNYLYSKHPDDVANLIARPYDARQELKSTQAKSDELVPQESTLQGLAYQEDRLNNNFMGDTDSITENTISLENTPIPDHESEPLFIMDDCQNRNFYNSHVHNYQHEQKHQFQLHESNCLSQDNMIDLSSSSGSTVCDTQLQYHYQQQSKTSSEITLSSMIGNKEEQQQQKTQPTSKYPSRKPTNPLNVLSSIKMSNSSSSTVSNFGSSVKFHAPVPTCPIEIENSNVTTTATATSITTTGTGTGTGTGTTATIVSQSKNRGKLKSRFSKKALANISNRRKSRVTNNCSVNGMNSNQ